MILNGTELAAYIKQRHFQQVKSLQHLSRKPSLAVVNANKEVVSSKYLDIKKRYGDDIGIKVSLYNETSETIEDTIRKLNSDNETHGIIVQLPLPERIDTEKIIGQIDVNKDVDGLKKDSIFDPPAPTAILWLLSGHGIDIASKKVAVIGQGRLVGAPLTEMLRNSGVEVLVCDEFSNNLEEVLGEAEVIITATGNPGLIKSKQVKAGSVVIDAGTANDKGSLAGDVEATAYKRDDIKLSPVPGGVGPLTVCALFENVLTAFLNADKTKQ